MDPGPTQKERNRVNWIIPTVDWGFGTASPRHSKPHHLLFHYHLAPTEATKNIRFTKLSILYRLWSMVFEILALSYKDTISCRVVCLVYRMGQNTYRGSAGLKERKDLFVPNSKGEEKRETTNKEFLRRGKASYITKFVFVLTGFLAGRFFTHPSNQPADQLGRYSRRSGKQKLK